MLVHLFIEKQPTVVAYIKGHFGDIFVIAFVGLKLLCPTPLTAMGGTFFEAWDTRSVYRLYCVLKKLRVCLNAFLSSACAL